jgi:hypothetical protein
MSYIGRGSYLAAAAAGVASAFYIFEPEFIALKRQRESLGQTPATRSTAEVTVAAASSPHSPSSTATSGRWQELQSRDGRVYWMNLDTGAQALYVQCLPLHMMFAFDGFFVYCIPMASPCGCA